MTPDENANHISFSGHPISLCLESAPQHETSASTNIQSALLKNGLHPSHSTSPATGYFGEHDTTHKAPVSSVQMHSLHSAETSSKQIQLQVLLLLNGYSVRASIAIPVLPSQEHSST